MRVLVDTSVWSTSFRAKDAAQRPEVRALIELLEDDFVVAVGPIVQEVLSGVKSEAQFTQMLSHLRRVPWIKLADEDYVSAARFWNRCRSRGIQASPTDMLICAVAEREQLQIFSTDADFEHFSPHVPIRIYSVKP